LHLEFVLNISTDFMGSFSVMPLEKLIRQRSDAL
jgi:hypothetical protein